jgi:hypothetical protein
MSRLLTGYSPFMLNISSLESSLWEAADQLRANSRLNANEYSMPVLGLIFLRHATNRFNVVKAEIEQNLPSRGGKKRPITQDDFKGKSAIFLPEEAKYQYILNLPEKANIGKTMLSYLQKNVVSELINVDTSRLPGADSGKEYDISQINFEVLKVEFTKSPTKNTSDYCTLRLRPGN